MKLARLKAFCAEDTRINVYYSPFFFAHVGQALRMWEDQCNNPNTIMGKHPADFRLALVGEFDDSSGEMFSSKPVVVATAQEMIKPKVSELRPASTQ